MSRVQGRAQMAHTQQAPLHSWLKKLKEHVELPPAFNKKEMIEQAGFFGIPVTVPQPFSLRFLGSEVAAA